MSDLTRTKSRTYRIAVRDLVLPAIQEILQNGVRVTDVNEAVGSAVAGVAGPVHQVQSALRGVSGLTDEQKKERLKGAAQLLIGAADGVAAAREALTSDAFFEELRARITAAAEQLDTELTDKLRAAAVTLDPEAAEAVGTGELAEDHEVWRRGGYSYHDNSDDDSDSDDDEDEDEDEDDGVTDGVK